MWKTKLWIRIESLFITELSFVAKTEIKTHDLRNHILLTFDGDKRGTEAERDNPKMFCKSKKIFRIDIF